MSTAERTKPKEDTNSPEQKNREAIVDAFDMPVTIYFLQFALLDFNLGKMNNRQLSRAFLDPYRSNTGKPAVIEFSKKIYDETGANTVYSDDRERAKQERAIVEKGLAVYFENLVEVPGALDKLLRLIQGMSVENRQKILNRIGAISKEAKEVIEKTLKKEETGNPAEEQENAVVTEWASFIDYIDNTTQQSLHVTQTATKILALVENPTIRQEIAARIQLHSLTRLHPEASGKMVASILKESGLPVEETIALREQVQEEIAAGNGADDQPEEHEDAEELPPAQGEGDDKKQTSELAVTVPFETAMLGDLSESQAILLLVLNFAHTQLLHAENLASGDNQPAHGDIAYRNIYRYVLDRVKEEINQGKGKVTFPDAIDDMYNNPFIDAAKRIREEYDTYWQEVPEHLPQEVALQMMRIVATTNTPEEFLDEVSELRQVDAAMPFMPPDMQAAIMLLSLTFVPEEGQEDVDKEERIVKPTDESEVAYDLFAKQFVLAPFRRLAVEWAEDALQAEGIENPANADELVYARIIDYPNRPDSKERLENIRADIYESSHIPVGVAARAILIEQAIAKRRDMNAESQTEALLAAFPKNYWLVTSYLREEKAKADVEAQETGPLPIVMQSAHKEFAQQRVFRKLRPKEIAKLTETTKLSSQDEKAREAQAQFHYEALATVLGFMESPGGRALVVRGFNTQDAELVGQRVKVERLGDRFEMYRTRNEMYVIRGDSKSEKVKNPEEVTSAIVTALINMDPKITPQIAQEFLKAVVPDIREAVIASLQQQTKQAAHQVLDLERQANFSFVDDEISQQILAETKNKYESLVRALNRINKNVEVYTYMLPETAEELPAVVESALGAFIAEQVEPMLADTVSTLYNNQRDQLEVLAHDEDWLYRKNPLATLEDFQKILRGTQILSKLQIEVSQREPFWMRQIRQAYPPYSPPSFEPESEPAVASIPFGQSSSLASVPGIQSPASSVQNNQGPVEIGEVRGQEEETVGAVLPVETQSTLERIFAERGIKTEEALGDVMYGLLVTTLTETLDIQLGDTKYAAIENLAEIITTNVETGAINRADIFTNTQEMLTGLPNLTPETKTRIRELVEAYQKIYREQFLPKKLVEMVEAYRNYKRLAAEAQEERQQGVIRRHEGFEIAENYAYEQAKSLGNRFAATDDELIPVLERMYFIESLGDEDRYADQHRMEVIAFIKSMANRAGSMLGLDGSDISNPQIPIPSKVAHKNSLAGQSGSESWLLEFPSSAPSVPTTTTAESSTLGNASLEIGGLAATKPVELSTQDIALKLQEQLGFERVTDMQAQRIKDIAKFVHDLVENVPLADREHITTEILQHINKYEEAIKKNTSEQIEKTPEGEIPDAKYLQVALKAMRDLKSNIKDVLKISQTDNLEGGFNAFFDNVTELSVGNLQANEQQKTDEKALRTFDELVKAAGETDEPKEAILHEFYEGIATYLSIVASGGEQQVAAKKIGDFLSSYETFVVDQGEEIAFILAATLTQLGNTRFENTLRSAIHDYATLQEAFSQRNQPDHAAETTQEFRTYPPLFTEEEGNFNQDAASQAIDAYIHAQTELKHAVWDREEKYIALREAYRGLREHGQAIPVRVIFEDALVRRTLANYFRSAINGISESEGSGQVVEAIGRFEANPTREGLDRILQEIEIVVGPKRNEKIGPEETVMAMDAFDAYFVQAYKALSLPASPATVVEETEHTALPAPILTQPVQSATQVSQASSDQDIRDGSVSQVERVEGGVAGDLDEQRVESLGVGNPFAKIFLEAKTQGYSLEEYEEALNKAFLDIETLESRERVDDAVELARWMDRLGNKHIMVPEYNGNHIEYRNGVLITTPEHQDAVVADLSTLALKARFVLGAKYTGLDKRIITYEYAPENDPNVRLLIALHEALLAGKQFQATKPVKNGLEGQATSQRERAPFNFDLATIQSSRERLVAIGNHDTAEDRVVIQAEVARMQKAFTDAVAQYFGGEDQTRQGEVRVIVQEQMQAYGQIIGDYFRSIAAHETMQPPSYIFLSEMILPAVGQKEKLPSAHWEQLKKVTVIIEEAVELKLARDILPPVKAIAYIESIRNAEAQVLAAHQLNYVNALQIPAEFATAFDHAFAQNDSSRILDILGRTLDEQSREQLHAAMAAQSVTPEAGNSLEDPANVTLRDRLSQFKASAVGEIDDEQAHAKWEELQAIMRTYAKHYNSQLTDVKIDALLRVLENQAHEIVYGEGSTLVDSDMVGRILGVQVTRRSELYDLARQYLTIAQQGESDQYQYEYAQNGPVIDFLQEAEEYYGLKALVAKIESRSRPEHAELLGALPLQREHFMELIFINRSLFEGNQDFIQLLNSIEGVAKSNPNFEVEVNERLVEEQVSREQIEAEVIAFMLAELQELPEQERQQLPQAYRNLPTMINQLLDLARPIIHQLAQQRNIPLPTRLSYQDRFDQNGFPKDY